MSSEDLIRDVLASSKEPEKSKSRYVEFHDVPSQRGRPIPKDVGKWAVGNFVSFARNLFRDRYGKDWALQFAPQCNEINLIKDKLVDLYGFVDNILLRDYIKWFFDNHVDYFITKQSTFFFSQMRIQWVLQRFFENYVYTGKSNTPEVKSSVKNVVDVPVFDDSKMEAVFKLSDEKFVLEYGIVLSVNWLINKRQFETKEALKFVYLACKKLAAKSQFEQVKKVTEKHNPYPSDAKFVQADIICKKVNPNLTIDVKTSTTSLVNVAWMHG